MEKKEFIKNYSEEELRAIIADFGEAPYRAGQIMSDIYKKRVLSFEGIKQIPVDLRNNLSKHFALNSIEIKKVSKSSDGSVKFLYKLHDGNHIEAVVMPGEYKDREYNTICISSQVGCQLGCAFCATGTIGLKRDLEPAEIIDQLLLAENETGIKISNIVFMGMGEPLLNWENVSKAVTIISKPDYKMVSHRKITISTSGIVPGIEKMAEFQPQLKLALSLHATTNGLRTKLIPISKKWDLQKLLATVDEYYRLTKIPITYEYILFEGLNDSEEDAKRLAKISRRVPSKVNIIPFNDISFTEYSKTGPELRPANKEKIESFAAYLKLLGTNVFVRESFGPDIEAACGQLALAEKKERDNENQ